MAADALSVYTSRKEFLYNHVQREKVLPIAKGSSDTRLNIKVNTQRKSLKGVALLFVAWSSMSRA